MAFALGDTVQLKSGGPAMTVVKTPDKQSGFVDPDTYTCDWFKGASREHGAFVGASLQAFVAPK